MISLVCGTLLALLFFSIWSLIANELTYNYKRKMLRWAHEDHCSWFNKSDWIKLESQSYRKLFNNKLLFKRFDDTISGEYKDEFINWLDRN